MLNLTEIPTISDDNTFRFLITMDIVMLFVVIIGIPCKKPLLPLPIFITNIIDFQEVCKFLQNKF